MNFKKIYTLKSNSILSLKEKNMNNDKKQLLKNDFSNNQIGNSLAFFNSNLGNPILIKFIKESKKGKCHNQKNQISVFDFIIPFICLKKNSKYNFLLLSNNIIHSYLSLEQYLPIIEGFSRLYYREGDKYRAKFIGSLFRFQYYDDF